MLEAADVQDDGQVLAGVRIGFAEATALEHLGGIEQGTAGLGRFTEGRNFVQSLRVLT